MRLTIKHLKYQTELGSLTCLLYLRTHRFLLPYGSNCNVKDVPLDMIKLQHKKLDFFTHILLTFYV